MKLEVKHLAAYLPYSLKGQIDLKDAGISHRDGENLRIKTLDFMNVDMFLNYAKPILKPLFALPQELVDMSPYNSHDELIEAIEEQSCPHNIYRSVIANHFDVFNLIEAGLAIDINTLSAGNA